MTHCQQSSEIMQAQKYFKHDTLENMSIAMAYVPWQHWRSTYEPDKALMIGTIFPELNKPFYGKRGVRR